MWRFFKTNNQCALKTRTSHGIEQSAAGNESTTAGDKIVLSAESAQYYWSEAVQNLVVWCSQSARDPASAFEENLLSITVKLPHSNTVNNHVRGCAIVLSTESGQCYWSEAVQNLTVWCSQSGESNQHI